MVLKLEKITIIKNGVTGEAQVKYDNLTINKVIIDLNSSVDTIALPKYNGSQIISGKMIVDLKDQILFLFQDILGEAENGMYEFTEEKEYSVTKLD